MNVLITYLITIVVMIVLFAIFRLELRDAYKADKYADEQGLEVFNEKMDDNGHGKPKDWWDEWYDV